MKSYKIKKNMLRAGAGIMSLALGMPAIAQSSDADAPEQLEEIIIQSFRAGKSGKDIPIKIDVFREDEVRLQQSLSTNPAEALANMVPSFAPSRQKLTGSGETFRGRTPLFLIDGVPQSTPLRPGAREGFTIDLEVIERIEVIFGANAIQGLGGTGGMINYITVSPPKTGELHQRASVSLTSNDDFNGDSFGWRAHYLVAKKFEKWDVTASASYEERGLMFDANDNAIGISNFQGDVADSYSRNFFGKVGYEPDEDQRFQFMVNDFYLEQNGNYIPLDGDRTLGIPTTSIEGDPEGGLPYNDVTTMSFDYHHDDFMGGRFVLQAYYQKFQALYGADIVASFQDPAIAVVGTLLEQSQNNSEKYGSRLTYGLDDIGGLPLNLILGFDFLRDQTAQPLVLTGRVSVPPTTFFNYAPFMQLNYELAEWATLSGGIRWEVANLKVPDYITRAGNRASSDFLPVPVEGGKRSFDDFLFNAGLVITPTDKLTVYASYAEAFSMPDVGRVLRSVSTFGESINTLLDIGPLVTANKEVGASYVADKWELRLNYFESSSDFGSRLIARDDGTFDLARQATKTSGWEVSGKLRPAEWLSLGAGYSLLNGVYDSNDDGVLDRDLGASEIGPDRLSLSMDITPKGKFSGRVQAFTYFSKSFLNAAGAEVASFDNYTTVDASVSVDLSPFEVSLSVSNLLDQQYITYFAQAATSANSLYDAGRGRTIILRTGVTF
ncbi:TonB-dependent receptor [Kordiimonas pumila]|uniref:TonB-dependent receptor n=1 Tax=Kordiimonas pumila TaxID=2161677 RepID=A0ABV7D4C6_9PROT|nr:TonB-dependent receptor [Kordiimonas pumila]